MKREKRPVRSMERILVYETRDGDSSSPQGTKYKAIRVNGKKMDEHRFVWEQAYGPIPPNHVVHHKNGNKSDNRLENLELLTLSDHAKHHVDIPFLHKKLNEARARRVKAILDSGVKTCPKCNEEKPLRDFPKCKSKATGYMSWCKECKNAKRRIDRSR